MLSKSCYNKGLHFCMRKSVSSAPVILQSSWHFWGARIPFLCFTNKTRPNNAWRWIWAQMQMNYFTYSLCFLEHWICLFMLTKRGLSMQNQILIRFHMRSNNTQNFMLYLLTSFTGFVLMFIFKKVMQFELSKLNMW